MEDERIMQSESIADCVKKADACMNQAVEADNIKECMFKGNEAIYHLLKGVLVQLADMQDERKKT
jgi:hypothetical protein